MDGIQLELLMLESQKKKFSIKKKKKQYTCGVGL